MATVIIMPRQGQSVESCLVGEWHKQKGDPVSVGDLLFTYETDKAVFEEVSKVDGVLLETFFEEGDDVPCLTNICVVGTPGENIDEFRPDIVTASQAAISEQSPSEHSQSASNENTSSYAVASNENSNAESLPTSNINESGNIPISPRARALAIKTNADLRFAVPTGAGGRIIEKDVQAVLSAGHRGGYGDVSVLQGKKPDAGKSEILYTLPDDAEFVKLSNIRKLIAKSMHDSLLNTAQLTNHSSFDATDILEYRNKLKAMPGAGGKTGITITDIIIYAVSRVLLEHKSLNAHFVGDKMAVFSNAHIGVAVDTPRGLLVPTIFNANKMSLEELSEHTKELFDKCKKGSVEPDLLKGATFTISNLGGFGVEVFTPILNPPQTGILGVCSIIERTKGGKHYPAMGLSLTYDHRAVDGADAARFSKGLSDALESFVLNFMDSL